MRQRIFQIVEKAAPGDKLSIYYDYFISAIAIMSLVPLMFKGMNPILYQINNISVYILFMDYILRWMVHDYARKEVGNKMAFVKYPFSFWAICDILAIMPTLGLLGKQFRVLRVFRIAKVFHHTKSFIYISNVFHKEKKTLGSVLIIAVAYIFISALIMFCSEPDTFDDFLEALYWATTALTTVGYGDVYPVSVIGRLISMVSSLFGIAVIALPAGVVTAGFMEEMNLDKEEKELAKAAAQEAAKSAVRSAGKSEELHDSDTTSAQEIMAVARARAQEVSEGLEAGSTPDEIRKGGEDHE